MPTIWQWGPFAEHEVIEYKELQETQDFETI